MSTLELQLAPRFWVYTGCLCSVECSPAFWKYNKIIVYICMFNRKTDFRRAVFLEIEGYLFHQTLILTVAGPLCILFLI